MLYNALFRRTGTAGVDDLRFEGWLAEVGGLVPTCGGGLRRRAQRGRCLGVNILLQAQLTACLLQADWIGRVLVPLSRGHGKLAFQVRRILLRGQPYTDGLLHLQGRVRC